MEELLARYLDGDLNEEEAELLIRASKDDPAVAADLREYESLLEAGANLDRLQAPGDLADRVMNAVHRPRSRRSRHLRALWPAAAALLLGMGLGHLAIPNGPDPERAQANYSPAVVFPTVSPAPAQPGVQTFQLVKLTYSPTRPDIERVSVAGSFNGWDPSVAPMSKSGEVWTVLLVLPPGAYEYMVVEDGERWVTDPSAPETRDDGFGGINGLLDLRS